MRADPHGVYEACFLEEGEVLGCYGLLDPCLGSAVLWQSSASRAKAQSRFLLPALFGIGTALPVIAASVVLTLGGKATSRFFDKMTSLELWVRRATGAIFVLVGIYYCFKYIFGLAI